MNIKHKIPEIAAVCMIVIFFLSGVLTLEEYGLAWDDALGNTFYGQRYLYFYFTGDQKYLDFMRDLPELSDQALDLNRSLFRGYPTGVFPPVADMLSAFTLEVFGYRLGWLSPEAAFHLSGVLLATLALAGVYLWTARAVGKVEGLAALFFLGTAPRFRGDMHVNIKDVPEMVFFTLTILAYTWWFTERKWSRALLAGILFGLGLGTKPNIVFLPLVVVLGLWGWSTLKELKDDPQKRLTFIRAHLLMVGGAVTTFWLTWPFMWQSPSHFIEYLQYFSTQVGRMPEKVWSAQPVQIALAVLPEAMLLFGAIGIGWVIFRMVRRKDTYGRLLLAWMIIPIARVCLPGMENFDGIRHYLEFLPAVAILAGMGLGVVLKALTVNRPSGRVAAGAVIVLVLTHYVAIYARVHPFEYIYFNQLVGGLNGAGQFFSADETTDYLCVTYPKGMRWLSENAMKNAKLYVPICGHVVNVTHGLWLREDIEVLDKEEFEGYQSLNGPVYSMFITRPSMYFAAVQQSFAEGELVYAVEAQQKLVMVIYRLK